MAAILNRRFTSSITYHDALHGFRAGRGTGTATLEAKILQQLAAMKEEVFYVIFLDLTKVYDALDRSRCLDILEGYGVGPNDRRLLKNYWRRLTMVARAGGYYKKAFKGERVVTQGYPLSSTIFNVVVDAVVRHWVNGLVDEAEAKGETGREGRHQAALFYANDGMVVSLDPTWLHLFHDQVHPVPDDRFHYHIKYGGGQQVALRHASLPSECRSVVTPRSGHHGQAAPEVYQ